MLNLSEIKKYGIYLYREKFCGRTAEAIVRVISVSEDEGVYYITLRVIEIKQGSFPKDVFRVVVGPVNYIKHEFYEIGGSER